MRIRKTHAVEDLLSFTWKWCRLDRAPPGMPGPAVPDPAPVPLRALFDGLADHAYAPPDRWAHPEWPRGLFNVQNQLLPPDRWRRHEGRIGFAVENQGGWEAFTRQRGADPAVEVVYDRGEEGEKRVRAGRLSHFLTTFCLNELVYGNNGWNRGKGIDFAGPGDLEEVRSTFAGAFVPLWSADCFAYPGVAYDFYLLDGKALFRHIHTPDRSDDFWDCTLRTRSPGISRWLASFAEQRQNQ